MEKVAKIACNLANLNYNIVISKLYGLKYEPNKFDYIENILYLDSAECKKSKCK